MGQKCRGGVFGGRSGELMVELSGDGAIVRFSGGMVMVWELVYQNFSAGFEKRHSRRE